MGTPPFEDVSPTKKMVNIPASYVSLPEGIIYPKQWATVTPNDHVILQQVGEPAAKRKRLNGPFVRAPFYDLRFHLNKMLSRAPVN